MGVGTSAALMQWLRELCERGHQLEQVLPAITSNVSSLLSLTGKGRIAPDMDADLVCLDESLQVQHVMAGGQWMVQDGVAVIKGRFEG